MDQVTNGGRDGAGVGGDDLRHAGLRTPPSPLPNAARLAADRHSRRVRLLKIVLPTAAVAVALAIAGVAWVQSRLQGVLDVRSVLFSKDGLTMVEPHLSGHASGRSYDVSAQRAVQNIQNPKIIALEGVSGRIEMADGTWAKIESEKGVYDGTREWLTLDGTVTVTTSSGWHAVGPHAEADLKDGRIVSDKRVRISGRSGWIESDGLDIADGGRHLKFDGDVRMQFQPGDPGSADGRPAPSPDARLP